MFLSVRTLTRMEFSANSCVCCGGEGSGFDQGGPDWNRT